MNPYVTGAAVKQLREKRNLTQAELADRIGVSAKTVQQLLGHADVSITLNTYTHVLPSMEQAAVETLDRIIFPKAENL